MTSPDPMAHPGAEPSHRSTPRRIRNGSRVSDMRCGTGVLSAGAVIGTDLFASPLGGSVRSAVTSVGAGPRCIGLDRHHGIEALLLMRFATTLLLLSLSIVLPGCSEAPPASDGDAGAGPLPLRLGVSSSLLSAPLLIARDQGLYGQVGVIPEIRFYQSGKAALAGLFADEVDVATVADPPIMHAALERTDFAVLAGFVSSHRHGKIVADRRAGIAEVGDLVGKRVGLSVGTTGQFYLYAFLIENGIPADAVQVVDIATKALPAALAERRVDAIASWEPNLLHARRLLGDEAIVFSSAKTYRNTFNLVATKATIADRPEVLTRLLRALMKAEELIAREPAKARAMVARALGEAPANIDDVWDDYAFKVFIDQGLILTLEDEARWELDRRGQVERPVPNFLDILHPQLLEQIDAGAVTVLR